MEKIDRRRVLQGSVLLASGGAFASAAQADVVAGRDPFNYEITRTEEVWREILGDAYPILREGKTERQKSSDLWDKTDVGAYVCKGCGLTQYSSSTKVVLDKGWLFFTASEPNAQLMSQDGEAEMSDNPSPFDVTIEVHCRRCGSHMGHVLPVIGKALHCINGASLKFEERAV